MLSGSLCERDIQSWCGCRVNLTLAHWGTAACVQLQQDEARMPCFLPQPG